MPSKLAARVGTAFEVANLLRNAGGFDTVMGALDSFLDKVEFGTYLGEAFVELASLVVEVTESLYLGEVVSVVQFGNGVAEGVEGRGRPIE